MASRFFTYDPYDYNYYYAPYNYYQWQPAPARRSKPAGAKRAPRTRDTETSFDIPLHWVDSDPEPERVPERKAAPAGARAAKPVEPAMSAEEAAVRMQAAARGFLARKSVRAVRQVQREAEQVWVKMVSEEEVLVADPRARLAVGEALMRMVLRLDAVRGAREYRRRVTKRVLALQDAVDALETKPVEEAAEVKALEATAVETAEESAAVLELPDANEMESVETAADMHTQVEIPEAIAAGEPEVEAGQQEEAAEEKEAVPNDAANVTVDEPEGSDAEDEWEMVAEENKHTAPVAATSDDREPPPLLETTGIASPEAASDAVDMRKVMEMVAALCEQSEKQRAVIGALVERVDTLERTVRRIEDAGKLITEGK